MSKYNSLSCITHSMIRATIGQFGELDISELCEYLSLDNNRSYMLLYTKLGALVDAGILKTDWSGKRYSLYLAPVNMGEE